MRRNRGMASTLCSPSCSYYTLAMDFAKSLCRTVAMFSWTRTGHCGARIESTAISSMESRRKQYGVLSVLVRSYRRAENPLEYKVELLSLVLGALTVLLATRIDPCSIRLLV